MYKLLSVVGSRIRQMRQQAGLSVLELARKIEVHPFTVSRWEGDWTPMQPSRENLKKVARVLRCKLADLLGE